MALTLKDRRLRAHAQQGGLCFYCCLPICEGDMQLFRCRYGLTTREAESLLSTAEHLVARKDGGTDGYSNVVAACWTCNQGRHQRENRDLDWLQFKALFERRMAAGKWRTRSFLLKLAEPTPRALRRCNRELTAGQHARETPWVLSPVARPLTGN